MTVPPGDMALFEEQFGEYTPDRTLVRATKRQIGPAAFAAKPKRVVPLRGVNYVKLLRRVRGAMLHVLPAATHRAVVLTARHASSFVGRPPRGRRCGRCTWRS